MKKGLIILSMAVLALVMIVYFSCDAFDSAKSETTFSYFEVNEGTDTVRASAGATTLYVATNGSSSNPGTIEAPTTIDDAILCIASGGTIYVRGGTYNRSTTVLIALNNNGASGSTKKIFAYNSEVPYFNFSGMATNGENRGFKVVGNYWHIKGITMYNAGDNGCIVMGDYNTIENCKFQANRDSGLQIARYLSSVPTADWPKGNLIKGCTSWDNYDPGSPAGEDADGFACKLSVNTGNVFENCYAHHNADDGWDLYTYSEYDPIGPVKLTGCTASYQGTTTGGLTASASDGNGFKLGGEGVSIRHTVLNCVSNYNKKDGFTANSNPGPIYLSGCTATGNSGVAFKDVTNQ
jgi:hypothetical protein